MSGWSSGDGNEDVDANLQIQTKEDPCGHGWIRSEVREMMSSNGNEVVTGGEGSLRDELECKNS